MRRLAVVATILLATTLAGGASASPTPAKLAAPAPEVKASSVWTIELAGAGCESDSFGPRHAFVAIPDTSRDRGRYRGTKKLTMTWTAGSASGDVFKGKWQKAAGDYVGTYSSAGQSDAATLVPVSVAGCAVVTTAPGSGSIVFGSADADTATVTGQDEIPPTGAVHFYVCPGDTTPCGATSPGVIDLGTVAVSGAGSVATATSPSFIPSATGVYCFDGVYSGDGHYPASSDGLVPEECFTVGPDTPGVTTKATSGSIVIGSGDTDTATVTGQGGFTPTGSVHFYVCPGNTDPCTVGAAADGGADLGTTSLSGTGGTATATSGAFVPISTGSYCFLGVYSGDGNYASSSDASTTDECFTVGSGTAPGPTIGLVALNKDGPHEVLAGGSGQFVVAGDIFLNTAVTNQPWTGTYEDPTTMDTWAWDDAIDAKTSSNLYVYGTIHSNNGTYNGNPLWPLDTCFSPSVFGDGNPLSSSQQQYQSGDPNAPGSQLPSQQMSCSEEGQSVTIDYDNIDPTVAQINDPLQATDAPPSPLSGTTDIACPGSAGTQVYTSAPAAVGGLVTLTPGEYQDPVELTANATFADCPNGYPGIYRFDQGLWINPGPGDTVTGSNVVIATEAPYPVAGNVPGSGSGAAFVASGAGNGAPCLPSTTLTSAGSGHGTPEAETSTSACGGTNPTTYGVIAYVDSILRPDPSMSGTGSNLSLIVGGASGSTVTLTGPTTGVYGNADGKPGLVLYQDPGTQANYGFDAEAGDAATIAINGVVYNASLANYGANAPMDYWDGIGGGIPFYAGGTLQTGYGTGWSDGPVPSGGSVTLDGTAIVDDFNTDGATGITILGAPYTLPGTQSSVARRMLQRHKRSKISVSRGRKQRVSTSLPWAP